MHTTATSKGRSSVALMRGDVSLAMRNVLRPEGTVGLIAAIAGTCAIIAAYLPWYRVSATVDLLGETSTRTVSSLPGWQAHPWGWLIPAVAVVMVASGVLLAIDRPAPFTPDLLLGGGMVIAMGVAIAGRWFPPVSRFDVGGTRLREMLSLAGRLPDDVQLVFAVHPGAGMWLALAAAGLLLLTGLTARAVR